VRFSSVGHAYAELEMPLRVITGPPNSGRTGAILEGFRAAFSEDPVLVVPTVDDVERFEEELTRGGGAVVGATVCTFDRLFDLVARTIGAPVGQSLSAVQRTRIAGEAVSRAHLRLLAASSERPGFAAALEELISELEAAAVDPPTLRERAAEQGEPYELELAGLYESFAEVRNELGREDSHSIAAAATAALRTHPDAWAARPVFLYGFDDLTVEQLELVRELWSAGPVTIAIPYEEREVLTAARSGLLAELRDTEGIRINALEPNPDFTRSTTLFDLERRFGEPPDEKEAIVNDGGLVLLASAGELAEAETVGAEVARLLHAEVPPGEIAIVLRDPASAGPLYRRVLTRFGIPVAVQADLPIVRTVTGAGLLALLDASVGAGRASDLLAYLRTPGIASPNQVDWFERRLRRNRVRTAEEALELWHQGERRELVEIARLREAGPDAALLREAARQARWIAEQALRRRGEVASEDRALELRAGAELERALGELAELGLPHSPPDVIAAVTELRVPLWRGPTEGRVRVISPYRARARRVRHLFVASLQDGDFPRRDSGGPLLDDDARAALKLAPRIDAELEDRYLFAVCLSRPKERLWLSWRSADDEGGATSRSRFVDEVRAMLDPPLPQDLEERDEAILADAHGRGLAESVFSPEAAPSVDELARALAASPPANGNGNGKRPAVPGLEKPIADGLAERLALAAAQTAPARLRPGPLAVPAVLERMAEQELFGPSTIEEYALCPYRWFVNHELNPQRIDAEEEAPTAGQIAHKVLERLYAEEPGGERRPTPATLLEWRRRAQELVEEIGPERLPRELAGTAAALRRLEGLVLAFLTDEAAAEVPFLPDPKLAEASFGDPDDEKEPLLIGTGAIHGRIDRIDIGPGEEALVQDYKSGASVEGGKKMLEKGKIQLQLYMLAVRELWGRELAGGLYRPLGGTSKRQPKGLLRKESVDDLAALDPRPGDHLGEEDFERALGDARDRAAEIIAAIQDGDVGRRPLGGRCPRYCDYQPICRRERGLPEEEPDSDEEEEE
jgi:ATP-dependent helicase/nuclease subunit B